MLMKSIIEAYLDAVFGGIKSDADAKGQKIPSDSFRKEATETDGQGYAAHYLKYLIHGRGPGKAPPPSEMLEHVQKNPDKLEEARKIFKNISEQSLAYLIGRKIAREGTDIYSGKKPGIDLEGSIQAPMEDFLKAIANSQAVEIGSRIKQAAAA